MFAKFSTSARSALLLPISTHCGSRRAKILIRNQDYANLLFACYQLCAFQLNLDVGQCQSCAPFEKPAPGIWRSLFREVHGLILLILIQDCMFGLVWFRSLANSFNSPQILASSGLARRDANFHKPRSCDLVYLRSFYLRLQSIYLAHTK